MNAFPQRGFCLLVATTVTLLVLPGAAAAQDPGTPSEPAGVLGRPLEPEPQPNPTEPVADPAEQPARSSDAVAPAAPAGGPLGRPLGRPLDRRAEPGAFDPGSADLDRLHPGTAELGTGTAEEGALAGRPLDGLELGRRSGAAAVRFIDHQLRYPRVRRAVATRSGKVSRLFLDHGIETPAEILFRVYKREQLMEVWARGAEDRTLTLVTTYAVCGTSGDFGPKRERGDEQIPEGFYTIDIFNPTSQYHLSLGVDYPNAVDRSRGRSRNLGGDIFVHGGCATVGCVPVTDEGIEEVYVMALMARDAGQHRIPIHLFPTRLDDDGFAWLRETFGEDHEDFDFWENLREGYQAFERTRVIPFVDHHRGRYSFPRGVAAPQ
jgi:murein L,D-transpeptidase YafK